MNQIIDPNILSVNEWTNLVVKLSLSLLVGSLIGLNRQSENKPAGLRTHMLVTLGSTIFVMSSFPIDQEQVNYESMSRVIQGITTGVGFLGAGEIFRQSDVSQNHIKISGLTSAAAIWVSSALGVAIGAGLYPLALVSVLMTWITLSIIKQFER